MPIFMTGGFAEPARTPIAERLHRNLYKRGKKARTQTFVGFWLHFLVGMPLFVVAWEVVERKNWSSRPFIV